MTGADSPVIALSSTLAIPSMTSPSAGIGSPVSQTNWSPFWSSDAPTRVSVPFASNLRANVVVLARRSESACALPLPSATASAKFANRTVNHSQIASCATNPRSSSGEVMLIVVSIVFNVLGTDNAIYVRNIVFYLLMYYFYTKGYFSIDVNKDSVQFVEDLIYSLTHPKKFFESLGDYVWEWFDLTMSIDLFIGYWILLTCVFMIYDNFNLFDVFDEFIDGGAWYAQNGVFYGIMFVMYLNGFFSLTNSAKELYEFFSTLSWREIVNLSVTLFLWLFFIVVPFVYAVILSAIIVVFSLATDVFNIFGSDNAVITRNVFFYIALCVIYSFGLMTFKIPDGQDIWSVINFLLF
jgi:hypothetical protein